MNIIKNLIFDEYQINGVSLLCASSKEFKHLSIPEIDEYFFNFEEANALINSINNGLEGYYRWRLPSTAEIEALYHLGAKFSGFINGHPSFRSYQPHEQLNGHYGFDLDNGSQCFCGSYYRMPILMVTER